MSPKCYDKKIGVIALVLLITGAIDSIRNLPTTALFGSALIFFFIFSAIVFLIPAGLVSAQLASTNTQESGIYAWVKAGLGEKLGFLAIWLQWINTMVWYPTILSFIAGTATYLISPKLVNSKVYLVSVILGVFWLLTFINLKGLSVSSRVASFCAILGMLIPMILIVTLAALWVISGKPLQIHFTSSAMLPSFSQSQNWISLTAIMTSFLGMELAAVHANDVRHPQKNFPKALFISVSLILITMIAGSLAIAIVLPKANIDLVAGIMQAFTAFFASYQLEWIMPVIAIMILLGSFGGMINWIISPARGLLQAAEHGFLPAFFKKKNERGVAANLLLTQAILVSMLCLTFLLMPSVNGSYWLLTDLSTEIYMLMYVLMFIVAIILRYRWHTTKKEVFQIPGGKMGTWVISLLGLVGCMITLIVGFFPPSNIDVGGAFHYRLIFSLGMVVMLLPVLFGFAHKRFSKAVACDTTLLNADVKETG